MNIEEIKAKLAGSDYDFLRNNKHLNNNVILLGLDGSYAYGTNVETSDLDIRGIATRSKRDILTGSDFEQVTDTKTDTTIYSFDKIIKLLCSCNPNTIEILGLKPEHYLYLSPAGKALIDNRHLFLSKQAINSFGGYANAQLRRLENKSSRLVAQDDMEKHFLKSIENASFELKSRHFDMPESAIKLYIDKAVSENYDAEIFMDVSLNHYPLRDYTGLWNELTAIVKSYDKVGKRNENAITHDKLGKHMMHLVRLYLMCFDILEKGEICTYREKEHRLLMNIRNGNYLDENKQPTSEFHDLVREFEDKLESLKKTTDLPDRPDVNAINNLVENINGEVCSRK